MEQDCGAEARTEKGEGGQPQLGRAVGRGRKGRSLAAVLNTLPGCPQGGPREEARRVGELAGNRQSRAFGCRFLAPGRGRRGRVQERHLASVGAASDPFLNSNPDNSNAACIYFWSSNSVPSIWHPFPVVITTSSKFKTKRLMPCPSEHSYPKADLSSMPQKMFTVRPRRASLTASAAPALTATPHALPR